jgi:hypothetical protein
VERNINACERDGGKTTFKYDITFGLLLFEGAVVAAVHNILQHILHLSEAEFLCQLNNNHEYKE